MTLRIKSQLLAAGWHVVYACVPNTAHLGVIPIPSSGPRSRQRYPDIVAVRGGVTRLIEIEPRLTRAVLSDIAGRFDDHVDALTTSSVWTTWCESIDKRNAFLMPEVFRPQLDLVVISNWSPNIPAPEAFNLTRADLFQP